MPIAVCCVIIVYISWVVISLTWVASHWNNLHLRSRAYYLLKSFFFFLVKFIDDITGGKCTDGEGGECTSLYCLYGDVNIFKGVAALNRVWILGFFYCPKQGQVFKPSAAQFHPNITRRVTPTLPPPPRNCIVTDHQTFQGRYYHNKNYVYNFQIKWWQDPRDKGKSFLFELRW